jgi:hypothetical protein
MKIDVGGWSSVIGKVATQRQKGKLGIIRFSPAKYIFSFTYRLKANLYLRLLYSFWKDQYTSIFA